MMGRNSFAIALPPRAGRAVAAVCLLFLGCSQEYLPELPLQAREFIRQQKWDEAIDLIKKHLLGCPDDVAAHFYLGQCYANAREPVLAVAEGEFQTALSLFRRSGAVPPMLEMTPKDFELRCYLEIADVYIKSLKIAARANASPSVLELLARNLENATKCAAKIAPDDPRVRRIDEFLNFVLRNRNPVPSDQKEGHFSI